MSETSEHCWHDFGMMHNGGAVRETPVRCCHCGAEATRREVLSWELMPGRGKRVHAERWREDGLFVGHSFFSREPFTAPCDPEAADARDAAIYADYLRRTNASPASASDQPQLPAAPSHPKEEP